MESRSIRRLGFPPVAGARICAFVLGMCASFCLSALGFNYPLQPEEIEEAYSLGRTTNHEDLANFLNQYEHDFKYPSDNPVAYVTSVEFQTPYEQIVLKSAGSARYDKFKAAEDYQTSAGAVFVRVLTSLRINFGGRVPPENSYHVIVSQPRPIEPRKTVGTVLCDPYGQTPYPTNTDCTVYTREILLRFDHNQFTSNKVAVKVLLPEGKSLETKFDLDKLK